MQVTEVATDGLKRAYTVTVPAAAVAAGRDKRLKQLAKDLRLPGFRPGNVPMSIVKQRYGAAVMGEVLEEQVGAAARKVVEDRGLRPAMQPKIEVVNFADDADLEFRLDVELLPEIPLPDFAAISVERLIAEPGEAEIEAAMGSLADRHATLEEVAEPRGAAKGEVLVCDFVGRLAEAPGANLLDADRLADAAPGVWPKRVPLDVHSVQGVASIAGLAEEDGQPALDISLNGEVQAGQVVRVFFQHGGVAAAGAPVYTVGASLRLVAGSLPPNAQARLRFNERDAERKVLATNHVDLDLDLASAEPGRLVRRLDDPEAAVNLLPYVDLRFPEAGRCEAVVRLGHMALLAGEVPLQAQKRAFPGGSGQDMSIEVGGGGFIPGFTEQLEGLAAGETRTIAVTFPADYGARELAGKAAEFEITAKALKRRVRPALDDAFAKSLGLEDLGALRAQARSALEREYQGLSRMKLKRALLDQLAAQASFAAPEGMVEGEFGQIWQRVEADLKAGRIDDEDSGKDEATLRAEYRAIAERRIRLGLLLSEIGRSNSIQVTSEELTRAMRAEAARYPGQEQQVVEFFRKNPQAVENLRAPLYEEKVIDFLLELAKVSERQVTPAELANPV